MNCFTALGLILLLKYGLAIVGSDSASTPALLGNEGHGESDQIHRQSRTTDFGNNTITGSGPLCSSSSHVSGITGELTSPNYPENYPNNITCIWKIESPEDRHTSIYFHEFDLEPGFINSAFSPFTRRECHFDMLYIAEEYSVDESDEEETPSHRIESNNANIARDKDPKTTHVSWGVFCGDDIPPPRVTEKPGSTLVIMFRSDGSETKTGFYASFRSEKSKIAKRDSDSREAAAPESISGFLNALWSLGNDESVRAYLAVIVFVSAVIVVIATAHCYTGRPYCGGISRWRRRARSSGSIPSIMMNMFGGSSRDSLRTLTPPPTYGDIVKTDEDWQEALRRMGETEESIEQYRSLPDNIQIVYDFAEPPEQRRPTDVETVHGASTNQLELPLVGRMSDPRGGVNDNFIDERGQPTQLSRGRNGYINGRRLKIAASIGRNDHQSLV